MSKPYEPELSPIAQAMLWENVSGQRLTWQERQRVVAGGDFEMPVPGECIDARSHGLQVIDVALLGFFYKTDHEAIDIELQLVSGKMDHWRERMRRALTAIGVIIKEETLSEGG